MSATTAMNVTSVISPRAGKDQRPGLGRLIAVELRKMVNTRSGFWLPFGVTLATIAVAVLASANHGGRAATLTHVLHDTAQPAVFLLPVMGVLLVCGEWSQRTTLTTFTLVPSRWRVIGAKVGAGVIVSTIAFVVSVLLTILCATALGHHPGGTGSLSWQVLGQSWLFMVSGMIMGLAFGAAILLSAPAIVAYLLLPTVWDAVVGGIHALDGVARWIDPSQSLDPLTLQAMSGTQWARALATFAVWIGIPIVIGVARIRGRDID
jgi:ABC-type transport system involved in multi-copper enzyme maturation permease subunit